jgi:hypothetical protein
MTESIKTAFNSCPFVMQWLIITAGKSLLASIAIGFLIDYALAWYSLQYGFRVPVEGVPFLKFCVGLLTFMVLMTGLFGFAIAMLGATIVKPGPLRPRFLRHPLVRGTDFVIGKVISPFAAIFTLFVLFVTLADPELVTKFSDASSRSRLLELLPILRYLDSPYLGLGTLAIILGGACFFLGFSAGAYGYDWVFGQIATSLILLAVASSLLFSQNHFASFLRIIRMGGGIEVNVHISSEDGKLTVFKKGYLLLLTQSHVILFDSKSKMISSYAARYNINIEHDVDVKWLLPSYSFKRQYELIK